MRRPGFRIRSREAVQRSPGFLLAIHHFDRRWCRRNFDPQSSFSADFHPVAGGEWNCDPSGAGFHAAAGEQEGTNGRVRELKTLKCDLLVHELIMTLLRIVWLCMWLAGR